MAWHTGKPADNDFLSASVQHIRENFAELEPLHPHVAELVDLTALQPYITELVDLTALRPYIDALLSSRIVDHNLDVPNPPNGYYVRWENGLQVCFGRWQLHPRNGGNSYEVRTGSFDWVFPAGFLSVPLVVAMGEPEYWGQPWQDSTYPINDYGSCSLSWGPDPNRLEPSGTSTRINYWYRIFNGQLYMHALAVGRWK